MSSFLSNSQNVLITGGQLISNDTRIEGSQNGLDILRQRTALGALLDSTERFDPPKCAPDTRVAIIHDILHWINNDEKISSVMWLYGPAGAGKTAIAQTIAEICQKQKQLVASFFFSRTAPGRSDGQLLIATLSYQLMLAFPPTRRLIKECVEGDPTIFDRANETQMERLFVDPINRYACSFLNVIFDMVAKKCFTIREPRLIVIDGLDECHDPKMQCDLLRIIGQATERLKLPFKFLICSRPESQILHVFNHDLTFQRLDIHIINLALDEQAHRDIQRFLSNEFSNIKQTHPLRSYLPESWPGSEATQQLVRKASGQFIYASAVIKYIQSPKHRPDDRLDVVLDLSPAPSHETPYSAELDALYTHIFSSFDRISMDRIRPILMIFGALIIPRNKGDGLGNFTTPNAMDSLLFFKPGDALLLLSDLQSLVSFGGRDTPVKLLNASLAYYFLDQSRSEKFHIDLTLVHSHIAGGYLARISSIVLAHKFHPLDLQSSVVPFLSHCMLVPLTEELKKHLMAFEFASICKTLIARHKSWLVLNPFHIWLLVSSFSNVLGRKIFPSRDGETLSARLADQLENLNNFLLLELKSTMVDNYFDDLIFKTQKYLTHPMNRIALASEKAQYLCLSCQLFFWDYNTSFVPDISLRYASAAKQCLKFISTSDLESDDLNNALRQFPNSSPDHGHRFVERAFLDCAIALLPFAGYEYDLVQCLIDFTFSISVLGLYPDKAQILTAKIIAYLKQQSVEYRISGTQLTKIKKRWAM